MENSSTYQAKPAPLVALEGADNSLENKQAGKDTNRFNADVTERLQVEAHGLLEPKDAKSKAEVVSKDSNIVITNGDGSKDLVIEPLNWSADKANAGGQPVELAQAEVIDKNQEQEPPQDIDQEAKKQEEQLRQALKNAFLKPEDGTAKEPEEIVKALEEVKLPTLDKIKDLEKLDIPELQDRIEFEPGLWHKIKENPLISALVAIGGYQVLKRGGKFVLQRTKNNAEAKGQVNSSESPKNQTEKESKAPPAETESDSEANRTRRPRLLDGESPTKFEERVEASKNGSGVFERRLTSGSEAILGSDKATESLTRNEVDTLKEEIKRLKDSKIETDTKRASNLERVVNILENSNSPKVQEAAHKYIRNRLEEARTAEARRGLKGSVGKAVGVGILVSAALAYYLSQRDSTPDLEEDNRASVSGK